MLPFFKFGASGCYNPISLLRSYPLTAGFGLLIVVIVDIFGVFKRVANPSVGFYCIEFILCMLLLRGTAGMAGGTMEEFF